MSHRDETDRILQEVRNWPTEDRVRLARELWEELPSEIRGRLSLIDRLAGVIKCKGTPPTDEEVKKSYSDYLLKKYA